MQPVRLPKMNVMIYNNNVFQHFYANSKLTSLFFSPGLSLDTRAYFFYRFCPNKKQRLLNSELGMRNVELKNVECALFSAFRIPTSAFLKPYTLNLCV